VTDLPTDFILGIRPEDVRPDNQGNFSGQVTLIEPLGVETILHIKVGGPILLSNVAGMSSWRIGDTIRFNIIRERLHFFEPTQQTRISVKEVVNTQ
jgi:ABC-type sugar transport system ATPase subunit